ncbi:MAG: hypothetical protein IJF07_03065 [Lachnospiraceae bacterium]|nr:hypothetical protein [Lachnospiraceae bacterium]
MIKLKLNEGSTVFDLLAMLCSKLSKNDEREAAIRWKTATEDTIEAFLAKYRNFIAIILNSSAHEYTFTSIECKYLNEELAKIEKWDKSKHEELFLLAVMVEKHIDVYSNWQCRGVCYLIKPLNVNFEDTGIRIYPYFSPRWNLDKSERGREFTWNDRFQNYQIIRKGDEAPFEVIMHYWNDEGLLQITEEGWILKAAITPVMDNAQFMCKDVSAQSGKGITIQGLANAKEVEQRVLQAFDVIFEKGYSLIMFPEVLGTKEVLEAIKDKMRMRPDCMTLVFVPTICKDGMNRLVVLGPGGVEVISKSKETPFILRDKDGNSKVEHLHYTNEVHVLITRELGNVAFPICSDLLDPFYYSLLLNVAHVNTILCPSCSPGIEAFKNTMLKGLASMLLSVWINTCSAKEVSNKGTISDTLGLVQLPKATDLGALYEINRMCQNGRCNATCYFDVTIEYKNNQFYVESSHFLCA